MDWLIWVLFWFVLGFLAYGLSKSLLREFYEQKQVIYKDASEYKDKLPIGWEKGYFYSKKDELWLRILFLSGPIGFSLIMTVNTILTFITLLWPAYEGRNIWQRWSFCLKMPKELCEPRPE